MTDLNSLENLFIISLVLVVVVGCTVLVQRSFKMKMNRSVASRVQPNLNLSHYAAAAAQTSSYFPQRVSQPQRGRQYPAARTHRAQASAYRALQRTPSSVRPGRRQTHSEEKAASINMGDFLKPAAIEPLRPGLTDLTPIEQKKYEFLQQKVGLREDQIELVMQKRRDYQANIQRNDGLPDQSRHFDHEQVEAMTQQHILWMQDFLGTENFNAFIEIENR